MIFLFFICNFAYFLTFFPWQQPHNSLRFVSISFRLLRVLHHALFQKNSQLVNFLVLLSLFLSIEHCWPFQPLVWLFWWEYHVPCTICSYCYQAYKSSYYHGLYSAYSAYNNYSQQSSYDTFFMRGYWRSFRFLGHFVLFGLICFSGCYYMRLNVIQLIDHGILRSPGSWVGPLMIVLYWICQLRGNTKIFGT